MILKRFFIITTVLITCPYFYLRIYLKKVLGRKNKSPKEILIIDNAKIGDIVCATPVFRAIKEKYPDSSLTVLVTPRTEGILKNNKRIDKVIPFDFNNFHNFSELLKLIGFLRKKNFDVGINLSLGVLNFVILLFSEIPERITTITKIHGLFYKILSLLCANHRLIYEKDYLSVRHYLDLLNFIGIENNNLKKEVYFDKEAVEKANIFLEENKISKDDVCVGIALTAGNKIKEWGVENFAKLTDLIIDKYDYKIIMVGSQADEEILKKAQKLTKNKITITYKDFSLKALPALLKNFNYFISVDSGPLYIANALGVPVIDILGPCSPKDQPPVYEKCQPVYIKDLYCRPCSFVIATAKTCREGHLRCLKETKPDMVLEGLERLIK